MKEKKVKGKMFIGIYFRYVRAIFWKNNVFIFLEFLCFYIIIDKLWFCKYYFNGLKNL